VVAIPEQVFYDDQTDPDGGRYLVRFAFCKTREVIADGVARLVAAELHA
jgi:N-succinyldiaminopimelate aminotransferase